MNKCIKEGVQAGVWALVLTVTACSQDGAQAPVGDTVVSGESSQQLNGDNTNRPAQGKTMDKLISDAVTDLVVRSGIEADAIAVREARAVTWGSSALGCPKKGMNYTQAIVPGVLLLLEADGTLYRYHGRSGSRLFYCPAGRAEAPAYGPGQEIM